MSARGDWSRSAVVYQVYPRSFADADGDGIGDIPGLISRLDYLASLSLDAIWISPFYTSPLHDGGYDVADYRSIDPRLGTLDDVSHLIEQAHARGMHVLMDIVPNHTSSEHAWFQELLAAGPESPAAERYIVRPGKAGGTEPPNNWRSVFHGAGWSPLPAPDGADSGFWYLHLFDSTQPDLNWQHPEVVAEFESILRFWFDLGVDGFRIDVAHGMVKAEGLPDVAEPSDEDEALLSEHRTPYWDQDGVHEIYRGWRAIADSYPDPRVFCGEAWVESEERLARYLRPDELHTSFNFEYLKAGWNAARMRAVIDQTIATHATIGAPPTWVLSNHDVIRHRTRMAPLDTAGRADLDRGLHRARAATLFALALPGSAYLYQGEELGLPEVVDLPDEARQDPAWLRSGGTDGVRDGCRVPIPWSGTDPSYGFGPGSSSWLPQPIEWADLSVQAQDSVEGSTLEFYRRALAARRAAASMGDGPLEWLPELEGEPAALGIRRTADDGSSVLAIINLGEANLRLAPSLGIEVIVESGEMVAVVSEDPTSEPRLVVGPETAVWLRG